LIKNMYTALHATRLRPGDTITLPEAPFVRLFVPRDTVTLKGAGARTTGDAVRFTATGGQQVTAKLVARPRSRNCCGVRGAGLVLGWSPSDRRECAA
jgi:hypothetical protein